MPNAAQYDKRLQNLGGMNENLYGLPTFSATDNIVAKAGGGQSLATPLVSVFNRVVTVATAADSVLLPLAVAGLEVSVSNASANALAIFPFLGDAVNAGAANAVYSLAAGKTATFFSASTLIWHALLSA